MSSNAGVAILGAGIFAKEAHLPALAILGGSFPALRAVYSRSENSARGLADLAKTKLNLAEGPDVYFDGDPSTSLDALLERADIGAVIVVMPITLQPSVVLKALQAGKHVISEKPVAQDVATALKLIDEYNTTYKPKGLVWRVAENYEAEPAFRLAGEAIRAGKIGDVISFKVYTANNLSTESKWYKTPWRTVPDYQGGFLLDGGVHTIAALRTILPKPLTHLSGFASLNKEYLKPHDSISAIARSETGNFHGSIELTWAFPTATIPLARLGDHYFVTGSRGWLSISGSGSPATYKTTIKSLQRGEDGKDVEVEEVTESLKQGIEAELRDFFSTIAGDEGNLGLGKPEGALEDLAVIQAALNSGGQLVDLVELQKRKD